MKIKVIGKAHFEGTSKKTGKEYNFHQIHYIGKSRGVEGDAALTLSLDPSFCALDSIKLGAVYNVDFDQRGQVVDFSLC